MSIMEGFSWSYRGRAFLRRMCPWINGIRRFLRNPSQRSIAKGFWGSLVASVHGKAFYSQHGEDKEVYEAFFSLAAPRAGFFVELGALDGVRYSNTKLFEDYLGWRGLLIEPVPEQFQRLRRNRPGNVLVCAAVSAKEGEVEFLRRTATAGIKHSMAEGFRKTWHSQDSCSFFVISIPFWKLLRRYKVSSIDLLSIDVEGGELEVLRTSDWDIPVHVVVIELDGNDENRDQLCRDLLTVHGFRVFKRLEISEMWHCSTYLDQVVATRTACALRPLADEHWPPLSAPIE